MTTIRFTEEDLELFQAASHDSNPLHTSPEYARRTAYGGRVVYGVLNAIAALGKTAVLERSGWVLYTIECDFFDVASLKVDYSVHVSEGSPAEITLRVNDGHRPVLEIFLTYRPGTTRSLRHSQGSPSLRSNAEDLQCSDFKVGQQ